MAKRKGSKRKASKAAKRHGPTIAHAKFGAKKFLCSGKRVRSGKSKVKHPRVFCRADKKK